MISLTALTSQDTRPEHELLESLETSMIDVNLSVDNIDIWEKCGSTVLCSHKSPAPLINLITDCFSRKSQSCFSLATRHALKWISPT